MKYGYAYQKQGGPMSWKNGPPVQARAADAKSLGSLGGTTLEGSVFGDKTLVLPKPGAPEVMPMGVGLGDVIIDCAPGYHSNGKDCVPNNTMATKRGTRGMRTKAMMAPPKYTASAYISSPTGQARTYIPTTAMKRSMNGADGLGDCGCGCGGGGGCGGGKLSIKFSDSIDDIFMWGSVAIGALTLWALLKKA